MPAALAERAIAGHNCRSPRTRRHGYDTADVHGDLLARERIRTPVES